MLLSNINNTASNIHICCCCCCWSYHKKIMKRKWDCSWILTSRQPHRVTSGRITHTTLFCTSLTHVTKAHVCLLHCYNVKPPIISDSLLQRQAPSYAYFTATTSSPQPCIHLSVHNKTCFGTTEANFFPILCAYLYSTGTHHWRDR